MEPSAGDVRGRFPIGAAATIGELEADPHPLLARLRASEPVSWLPALDGWLVTRRDLALAALRDAATFTVDDPRFSTAQVIGPSMLSLDGAEHARHRDPFARAFRPAATRARFAAFVAAEVDRLVGALRPRGAAELRGELAGPLAVAVIAHALGLRAVDPPTVRSWYEAFVATISDITAGRPGEHATAAAAGGAGKSAGEAAHERAYARLRASVEAAIREGGAAEPAEPAEPAGADPLLVAAARELPPADVVANAAVLMFGGIDTTEGMITNAVLHLLDHPGQLALVRAEPALVAEAIEESLRLEPSASVVDRYATRDIELGGAPIRAGDLVRVSLAAAGRDPAAFPDPDRFDVRRAGLGKQLAFAHGPHFCFGAPLARLETHAVLTALLHRLPGLRADPARRHPPRGLVFRKPAALYVRWNAGSAGVSAGR
ncbi:MAG TPA: cytochrome P450 [Streptosporangiaceae bacterium]|nr:cytochrome P450 [Streptosporangiaceae bacterium]